MPYCWEYTYAKVSPTLQTQHTYCVSDSLLSPLPVWLTILRSNFCFSGKTTATVNVVSIPLFSKMRSWAQLNALSKQMKTSLVLLIKLTFSSITLVESELSSVLMVRFSNGFVSLNMVLLR